MNIFVLDNEPTKASLYHCDKHIVKMPLETAQMLCTAHHLVGSIAPYKKAHPKHPCNLWVLESIENYRWLCTFGLALCKEYSFRYDKIHKCEEIIQWCASNEPRLPKIPRTPFALAMPIECKTEDSVQSYRNYYIAYKQNLYSWKKREKPEWLLT